MKIKQFLTISVISMAFVSSMFFALNIKAQTKKPTSTPPPVENEYQVGAVIFHQKAAEYRALAYQSFNLAKMQLDLDKKRSKKLPKKERKKPRAIVVDADETTLDNSPYFAKLIKEQKPFNIRSFFDWKKSGKSKAIPGSVEFLNYAKRKGVEIFYVSNVPNSFKEVTINSLKQNDFPDVTEKNVMLITDSSSKEPRRQKVAETHRIVMFIGDSLNDLSVVFERKSTAERFAEVEKMKKLWGTKFIVIPNVIYGAWESAVYEGRLNDTQKKAKRIKILEDY